MIHLYPKRFIIHNSSVYRHLLVIIFLCLSLNFIWFSDGKLLGGGEEGIPFYSLSKTIEITSLFWRDSNTGYPTATDINRLPFYYLLSFLSLVSSDGVFLQALASFIFMTTGGLSVYFLIKYTVSIDSKYTYLPLVGALFYILNPYTMSQIFGRGLYMQLYPYALFPLFLLMFVLACLKKKVVYILLGLVFSFIFAGAFGNPSYAFSLWLMLGSYLIFYLYFIEKSNIERLKVAGLFVMMLIGWVMLQLEWVLPYLKTPSLSGSISDSSLENNLASLRGVSNHFPLTSIIRLIQNYVFYIANTYGAIYTSIIFLALSWIIPLVAIFSFKFIKDNKYLTFFGFLLVFSLFICNGANMPSGWLYEILFKYLPYFQVYRNPYEKFGVVLLIAYTPFFAFGLVGLYEKLKKINIILAYLIPALLVVGINVYLWPIWTGRVVKPDVNVNSFYVPEYYKKANDFIKALDVDDQSRLLVAPIPGGDGVKLKWGDSYYVGVDPYLYLLDVPVFSNTLQIPFTFDLVQSIRKNISQADVLPALNLLRFKYLMIREDMVVDSVNKFQTGYLLNEIYPPVSLSGTKEVDCKSESGFTAIADGLWMHCNLMGDSQNWEGIRYLHLSMSTDVDSLVEIALSDEEDMRPRWFGKDYKTTGGQRSEIILPINFPAEGRDRFDFKKVKKVEVLVHAIKEKPKLAKVDGIYIDVGSSQKVDNFESIGSAGLLKFYRNKSYKAPEEFGVLGRLIESKDTDDLINKSIIHRESLDKTGIYVLEQNKDKKIDLNIKNEARGEKVTRVSNSSYVIDLPDNLRQYLILSKSFDQGWKIIPGVSESDMSSSLDKLWDLVQREYVFEDKHFVVNGYANGWEIDGLQKKYGLIFLPEIYSRIGWIISLNVFYITVIFVVFLILKEAKRDKKIS